MAAIRRVAETGLPILLVEQNVKQVLAVSHRTYVLEMAAKSSIARRRSFKGIP